jgi:hypothetical protein
MITFVTTFKQFRPPFDVIQLNALNSWLRFCPPCEVVIVGPDEGVEDAVKHLPHIKIIHNVKRSSSGTPFLDDLIRQGEKVAANDLICLINGDIIIVDDILKVVKSVYKIFNTNFLLISRRYDMNINKLLKYDNELINYIRNHILSQYVKLNKKPLCTDLFVFGKGLFDKIPPLVIGRLIWARWLIYKALSYGIPVIDATEVLTVIHQLHNYDHISNLPIKNSFTKVKSSYVDITFTQDYKWNLIHAGVATYFSEKDCNYVLTYSGLKKKNDMEYLLRKLVMMPLLNRLTSPFALSVIKTLLPIKVARKTLKKMMFTRKILY